MQLRTTAPVLALLVLPACLNLPIPRAIPASGLDSQPRASVKSPRNRAESPFKNAYFYVDPDSNAGRQVRQWRQSRPEDASLIDKIARQPAATWLGDWTPVIGNAVARLVEGQTRIGALPVFVLYNVPNRDCGQYSKGGAVGPESYRRWIDEVRRGIGERRAVAVLEPDALGLLDRCLGSADQQARLGMIRYAVHALESTPGAAVYIDAGHDGWMPAADMAERLNQAGIDEATGFALNTSNYRATDQLLDYGREISQRVGGKHFIIDTGRNGNGPPENVSGPSEAAWCNPEGRALGTPPTTKTGEPLCDAFFWVKPPGESDGTCNRGPRAGVWWPEYALGLARRARW